MIDTVEVTYEGPYGAYSLPDFDGYAYSFPKGAAVPVPEKVAEHLLDVQGHTFTVGDEVEVAEIPGAFDLGSGSGSGSGDDPQGVNASSSYGGGS